MNKKTRNILLIIGTLVIIGVILWLTLRDRRGDTAATEQPAADLVATTAGSVTVTQKSSNTPTLAGTSKTSVSVKPTDTTNSSSETPADAKGLSPKFLQDLVTKGVDTIYKYTYQDKVYYLTIDNEIVNVGGKNQVYNATGVNIASCSTVSTESNPPVCASSLSPNQKIYGHK